MESSEHMGASTGHSRVPDVDDGRGATLWLFNIDGKLPIDI